ncbi:hypothetical protein BUALT_Bualt03G0085500 [Buddleja alternifolia]|uniref:HECT-type E3 ubiquitin transferase n=1 Tax=Buddleja alternifolia TaxID=168488 RepID=A0AAV6Y2X8_9LAMI|nr:hypothetical protein BUALT_Bualt03G0085500 [Buddleja alternifolia]
MIVPTTPFSLYAADEAIKQFITSIKNVLPKHTYHECVPIVLEFCRLLKRAAGIDGPLYGVCRSNLGTILEYIEIGEKKGMIGLCHIFPFVSELASKLSHDLVLSTESSSFVGPSLSDVSDFTAFLVPMTNEIKGNAVFRGPIGFPLNEELSSLPVLYAEPITLLHNIFVDLLSKLEKCMVKVEDHVDRAMKQDGETLFFGWCQYLAILRELYSISKFYYGCEEMFWETMKRRKGALCYLIVKYAKRGDGHKWIIECKEVTNFEPSRLLAMMMLPEPGVVDRSQLLAESFEYIAHADADSLHAGLFMEFKNDEATSPGILREWFFLVFQAIFNPQSALFVACPNDPRRFFPNPASKVDPLQLEYFSFSGRVLALALMHKAQIGDRDALGLTLVHEIEELGTRNVFELCPGSPFCSRVSDIMSCKRLQRSFFQCLDPENLDWMLHGRESAVSVDDWKAHTEYHGFKETDAQISWFWKLLAKMEEPSVEWEEAFPKLGFTWLVILPVEGHIILSTTPELEKAFRQKLDLPAARKSIIGGFRIPWAPAHRKKPPTPLSQMSSSSLSKRKLDDYADDAVFTLSPTTRMRKDQTDLPSSSNLPPVPTSLSTRPRSSLTESPNSLTRLQFFVRILSDHTQVVQADSNDTIISIHEKIQLATGIPIIEQRLIYGGKQLQWEQTLADCKVEKDAGLHLVGRMRSTGHPKAWQLIDDVVSLIIQLCKNNCPPPLLAPMTSPKTVKSMLMQFLSMTPRTVSDQASGHLQIFTASSAPSALVMLYMSSHKPNRDAADEAIKQFITSIKNVLPKHTYHECVPIVLEFCRLLKGAAGSDDPLYGVCRSNLGTIVEYIEIGEKKGMIGLCDIFPFVSELASKISHDLVLSTESSSFVGPSLSDVSDFTAFLVPVTNEIKGNAVVRGPIGFPLNEELSSLPVFYAEQITLLHGIFVDLLSKLEKCLVKVEDYVDRAKKQDSETLFFGWCQYLAILGELNSISKLYYGCEEMFWETMKRRKGALCYLIVKYAKRSDDHKWIIECKEVTNFEARRHLAMMMLSEVKDDCEELHEMLIDRSQLLAESFEYIARADADSLRAGLFMEFKNEEATGPGVLREWFFLVCQAIFNPQNALFVACPNDRRRFFPNPASKVDPLHLEYFSFSGRVIALALMHKVQIGIVFDRVFFTQLAGNIVTLEDIRDADPYLYSSCKQILEMDPEAVDQDALGLTFVHEIEELGSRKVVELCPGGRSLVVNSKNREKYVDALIQHRFVITIAEQVAHFVQGFSDIMSCKRLQRAFFQCLEPEDLDWMLHGRESAISVDDWKAHTEYHGFKETDAQISWFWKEVGNMSSEQKKVLLFFWTSIKYLPIEGFSGLASRLYIYKTSESSDHLPSSHTCFYRLCLPTYPTIAIMHDRLRIITQEHVGCSFGTW